MPTAKRSASLEVRDDPERESEKHQSEDCRIASGKAMKSTNEILLSGHKVERDKTVAKSGGSLERTSEG